MTTCVRPRCDTPTDGIAYACPGCAKRAGEQLVEILDLLPAALDVAYGQTSSGPAIGGGAYGPREELRLTAKDRLDKSRGLLGTWVRHIAPQRPGHLPDDTLDAIARWLMLHLEWARGKRWAEEFLADIEACAGVIRGVASGPRERRYLGPCGAKVVVDVDTSACGCDHEGLDAMFHTQPCPVASEPRTATCEGAVYGGIGGRWAICKDCGARYDQAARVAERAELAHGYWYTAAEIAEAYSLPASSIRVWRHRGLLTPRAEHDGHPLYAVADVLALVATSKDRAGQWRRETAEMGA
jgi:hypothetical protein